MPADPNTAAILASARKLQSAEIRRGQAEHGWTHAAVAEAVGTSRDVWISWQRGRRTAPPEVRERLAELWGLDRGRLGLDPERVCPCCGHQRPRVRAGRPR